MRYQAVEAGTEIQAIVAHGRILLSRAVRSAWEGSILTRDPDGLFSGVLGANDIEKLLARTEAEPPPAPPSAAPTRLAVPRLRVLLDSIGCGAAAEDVLAVALAIELDAACRSLVSYLRGNTVGAALTVGTMVLALGEPRTP